MSTPKVLPPSPFKGQLGIGARNTAAPSGIAKPLHVANLRNTVTEFDLFLYFFNFGRVVDCWIGRNDDGTQADFGKVYFEDKRRAEHALRALDGRKLHGLELRVSWAISKEQAKRLCVDIVVMDLSGEVDDFHLKQAFSTCPGFINARVVWDHREDGGSRGYGFVSFRKADDAITAIRKFDGLVIGNRKIRCNWADHNRIPKSAVLPRLPPRCQCEIDSKVRRKLF